MGTIKERLLIFIRSQEISVSEFERRITAGNGYVTHLKGDIKPERLQEISMKFPQLNLNWLLYDEGKMLQNPENFASDHDGVYESIQVKGKSAKELREIVKTQQEIIGRLQEIIKNYQTLVDKLNL